MVLRLAPLALLGAALFGCGTRTAQLPRDQEVHHPPIDGGGVYDAGPSDMLPDICKAWTCTTTQGRTFCHNAQSPGLPGVGFWACHLLSPLADVPLWRCDGAVPYGGLVELVVPCAGQWSCRKIGDNGQHDLYRCEKPDDALDRPPPETTAGKHVVCIKGSSWGTRCELLDTPPQFPPPWAELSAANDRCRPGTQLWCTRPQGEWGLVSCGDDGRWPGRFGGKLGYVLDCQPTPDGRVPDTACACYFTAKAHSACCERSDCLLPWGGVGRRCEASPGQLCDACDPKAPSCAAGAVCLLENSGEAYCTRGCAEQPCPADAQCLDIEAASSQQCLPRDRSCYF